MLSENPRKFSSIGPPNGAFLSTFTIVPGVKPIDSNLRLKTLPEAPKLTTLTLRLASMLAKLVLIISPRLKGLLSQLEFFYSQ